MACSLARQLVPFDSANSFDLEDPISLARLDEPMTALAQRGYSLNARARVLPLAEALAEVA